MEIQLLKLQEFSQFFIYLQSSELPEQKLIQLIQSALINGRKVLYNLLLNYFEFKGKL